ncbi:LLM class flavin-dependent oxidoreductase [Streptomyces sp. LN500]|uniref:LLM class flavin-dependent oxidoreductase n=1 Tax=Streptomyces sp. LN500 TaxID=3112978 RepID=UPI0037178163
MRRGVGWSAEEFAALGVPFAGRGRRTEEYLAAMRAVWAEDPASFTGELSHGDAGVLARSRRGGFGGPATSGTVGWVSGSPAGPSAARRRATKAIAMSASATVPESAGQYT